MVKFNYYIINLNTWNKKINELVFPPQGISRIQISERRVLFNTILNLNSKNL